MSEQESVGTPPDMRSVLIDLAVESWRFSRLFVRVLTKLDAGESQRYASQLRYFLKRVEDGLDQAELKLVSLEGQPYDPGMAATALNVADFTEHDRLIVDQMLEPIIMGPDGLLRAGVVMLTKVES